MNLARGMALRLFRIHTHDECSKWEVRKCKLPQCRNHPACSLPAASPTYSVPPVTLAVRRRHRSISRPIMPNTHLSGVAAARPSSRLVMTQSIAKFTTFDKNGTSMRARLSICRGLLDTRVWSAWTDQFLVESIRFTRTSVIFRQQSGQGSETFLNWQLRRGQLGDRRFHQNARAKKNLSQTLAGSAMGY